MTSKIPPGRLAQKFVPWIIAGATLLFFLFTLNHWVTLNSLGAMSKVAGWDTVPAYTQPLLFILTLPIRYFPAGIQFLAMNFVSAVCAGLTLALLARSISLLPHDRTRDQRQRQTDENALLTIGTAWIAPVFGALIFMFQLTFWEHATAGTGEMLQLLLFAYVCRCLLEYRVSENERWLSKLAFVYGLGVAENWAMIGFFPLFLIALVWIKRLRFFRLDFVLRMVAFGSAGLLLYLVLPLAHTISESSSTSFFEALMNNWRTQKYYLWNTPFARGALRLHLFMMSLSSILPILLMSIRWPSFRGDVSAAAARMTDIMFRVMHVGLLAVCLWVFFDAKFSPRQLGYNLLPFLTFYYLTALGVGYFSGYILLVFGVQAQRSWERSRHSFAWLNRAIAGALILTAAVTPAALCYKNYKPIRGGAEAMLRFAERLSTALPEKPTVLFSDDGTLLTLLRAVRQRADRTNSDLLVDTTQLERADYHKHLYKNYPAFRDTLFDPEKIPASLNSMALITWAESLQKQHPLFYLHPSFGYYFERFYAQPHGLIYEVLPYTNMTEFIPPTPTVDAIAENEKFWQHAQETEAALPRHASKIADARWLAAVYARALNYWGVEMQKATRLKEAEDHFATALSWNPDNVAAAINREFNLQLQSGDVRSVETSPDIGRKLKEYRSWLVALNQNGPFDDTEVRMSLGVAFLNGGNIRQAAHEFLRILEVKPDHVSAQLALAGAYIGINAPDKTLELVAKLRAQSEKQPFTEMQMSEVKRFEAEAYSLKGDNQLAEEILLEARTSAPENDYVAEVLLQFYLQKRRPADALGVVEQQLKRDPNHRQALLNKGALLMMQTNYTEAVVTLDRLLDMDPKNGMALINRAIANFQLEKYDESKRDYETLLKLSPAKQYAVYHGLAEIAYRTGDKREALRNYKLFLESAPAGTDEYNKVLERVKELEPGKSP